MLNEVRGLLDLVGGDDVVDVAVGCFVASLHELVELVLHGGRAGLDPLQEGSNYAVVAEVLCPVLDAVVLPFGEERVLNKLVGCAAGEAVGERRDDGFLVKVVVCAAVPEFSKDEAEADAVLSRDGFGEVVVRRVERGKDVEVGFDEFLDLGGVDRVEACDSATVSG